MQLGKNSPSHVSHAAPFFPKMLNSYLRPHVFSFLSGTQALPLLGILNKMSIIGFYAVFWGIFPMYSFRAGKEVSVAEQKKQRLATIVGANITAQRRLMGWNQAEFAERLGIGPDSLSRIERGLVAPRFPRLEQMASLLECSVYELFQTQEEREQATERSGTVGSFSSLDLSTRREVMLMAERIIQLMRS
ncbi:MAG: helix-turn-helix transcriptional regulator [Desulfovibrionaceae bacterium]|nr:helix-turn-helix transcriptional regulator [Desulfovibrionaceae bacterium]